MEKSIRVRILERDYSLLVREDDEGLTRDIVAYVDAKMQAFREEHPNQSEITAAVITALAIAEELYTAWEDQDQLRAELEETLGGLADRLDEALPAPAEDAPQPHAGPDAEPDAEVGLEPEEVLDSATSNP